MDMYESTLAERLVLIEEVKATFKKLYPEKPHRLRRGETQEAILEAIKQPLTGYNRRFVSEALSQFGYSKVKNTGIYFYQQKRSH